MFTRNLVTIILATYQGEAYLKEQLQSLVSQTYKPIEIHIYDDCSTDNTISIIEEYTNNYPFIKLHQNEKNIGFVKNFEQGIQLSNSNYIALSDQDDIWNKDKIEKQMTLLKELERDNPSKPILIHSDLSIIDSSGKTTHQSFFKFRGIKYTNEKDIALMLGHSGVMGNTILMNRKLAETAIPFPNPLKTHDYWIALVNEFTGIRGVLDEALLKYRQHSSNTSSPKNTNKVLRSLFLLIQSIYSQNAVLYFVNDRTRKSTIEYLCKSHYVNPDDKKITQDFIQYLEMKGNKFKLAIMALKRGFIRGSLFFKLAFILEFVTTKRYF